jgi:hypothetical protein
VAGAFHKLDVVEAEDSRVVVVTLNYTRFLYENVQFVRYFVPIGTVYSFTRIRILYYTVQYTVHMQRGYF